MLRRWLTPAVVAFVSVGTLHALTTSPSPGLASASSSTDDLGAYGDLAHAFERIAEHSSPSVVSIASVRQPKLQRSQSLGQGIPPQLRGLFGDRMHFMQPEIRMAPQQNQGAGFVIRSDGYIATNHHVVADADHVEIQFADGRTLPAEIVGSDAKTDVAVVKVDAKDLPALELGNSDDLRPGQWIAAVGNPFGLSTTITSGIVSATGRTRLGLTDYEDFIQTDAAINPGNSGGPMLDLAGRVIGINSAIFTRDGGSMGIGFAIPINLARDVIEDLIEDGRVTRGWLGVMIQDLDEDLARSFGHDGTEGALVNQVTEDGPASRAGIRVGDIVVRVGSDEIASVNELRLVIASLDPDTEVEVEVVRDGKTRIHDVLLGDLGDGMPKSESAQKDGDLGLSIGELDARARRQLGYSNEVRGALVTQVRAFSPAARAGLQAGDVITAVGSETIENRQEFEHAMRSVELESGVRLVVHSSQGQRFVFLRGAGTDEGELR